MARSPSAARLTEAHRLAQARVGAGTTTQMRAVWKTLDVNDLDGSFDRWLNLAAPIVRANRMTSARLAANYYLVHRKLELPGETPIIPTLAETVSAERLATSLRVTGPISLKANIGRGMDLFAAAQIADDRSAASAARFVLEGGRQTLMDTIVADPKSGRWQRVGGGNSCEFCSMLIDRGAVYSSDTADFEAHDHCTCTAEPAY